MNEESARGIVRKLAPLITQISFSTSDDTCHIQASHVLSAYDMPQMNLERCEMKVQAGIRRGPMNVLAKHRIQDLEIRICTHTMYLQQYIVK